MEKTKITEDVKESFLKGVLKIGEIDLKTSERLPISDLPFIGEEIELVSRVDIPDLGVDYAKTTLTIFDDDVVQISVMLSGVCNDETRANEEAEKYHEELKNGYVWGFYEDFYHGDVARICTSFDYVDEKTLCSEVEGRLSYFGDQIFINKLKPILKYFTKEEK